MNHDDFDDSGFGPDDDDGPDAILELLDISAQWLTANPDPQAFIERMKREGLSLVPELGALSAPSGETLDEKGLASMLGVLAWNIVSSTPMPDNGFRPRRLPTPGRNDPCVCGSGRKFKQCCAPYFSQLPQLDAQLLGALMVKALPAERWATLPRESAPPAMVATAATLLWEQALEDDALRLLEPWAQQPGPWPDARADLLDLLGDLYLDFDMPAERERLAHDMVSRGDKQVQSLGWQRLSLMATDSGDEAAAREAFEKAQRLTPNDPRVALLEVTTLFGQGKTERARERAAFHARRLSRLPEAPALAEEIEALQELADGGSALSHQAGAMLGGSGFLQVFAQLKSWLDTLPPPKLRVSLPEQACTDLGELRPTASAKKALQRWQDVFEYTPPRMAWEHAGDDALEAFGTDQLLPELKSQPLLADCFDVIDGLYSALGMVPFQLAEPAQAALMQRALQLWQQLREQHPAALCEWGHWGNRPALRLLATHIENDDSPTAEVAYPWLRHLVEVLNPHDNHGLRERLAAVYLRRGEADAALHLCERYPDDMLGMTLLHARTLLALGRLDEAAARLTTALERNEHARKLLLSKRAPRLPDVPSYQLGSAEEACIALAPQFDLWRQDAAVWKWLQQRLNPVVGGATPSLFD